MMALELWLVYGVAEVEQVEQQDKKTVSTFGDNKYHIQETKRKNETAGWIHSLDRQSESGGHRALGR